MIPLLATQSAPQTPTVAATATAVTTAAPATIFQAPRRLLQ